MTWICNTNVFLFVVIVHRASSISSLKYLNDTDKYPIFLVDKHILFLTSNVPKRGRYINAITVPVSFENHCFRQFWNRLLLT